MFGGFDVYAYGAVSENLCVPAMYTLLAVIFRSKQLFLCCPVNAVLRTGCREQNLFIPEISAVRLGPPSIDSVNIDGCATGMTYFVKVFMLAPKGLLSRRLMLTGVTPFVRPTLTLLIPLFLHFV